MSNTWKGKNEVKEEVVRAKPKPSPVRDDEGTPYQLEELQALLEKLLSAPVIEKRRAQNGEPYRQVREFLLPGIVKLFERGYNRKMIREMIAQEWGVGHRNRIVVKVVEEGFAAYTKRIMREGEDNE